MKYRLLDLLQCSCGKSGLTLEGAVVKNIPFGDTLPQVRCSNACAFKNCLPTVGNVSPADCTSCYGQEVIEGNLRCECGQTWPIIGGIPRLLPKAMSEDIKKTQATFSHEWKMFRFGERNWGQDISFRKQLFLRGMGVDPGEMKGKLIFDAGCGSGALSLEMSKSLGMEVVALDLAFGIENAYRHNDSPYVHFVQGSVLEPPLRTGVFDYVYCAGVLVVCPDAKAGFKAVIRTVKHGGRCFTWWYHPINPTYYPDAWRKMIVYTWIREHITARLPIRVQYYMYLSWIVPFMLKQSVERLIGHRLSRPYTKPNPRTWREKMQGFFDFFSPQYFHRYEPSEIVAWYHEAGFPDAEVAYREYEGFAVRGDIAQPSDALSEGVVGAALR